MRIKQAVCNKWKEIGNLLQIDKALIERWDRRFSRDSLECCDALFNYWLDNPCPLYPPTWDGVCRLLVDAQFSQVASELKEALQVLST